MIYSKRFHLFQISRTLRETIKIISNVIIKHKVDKSRSIAVDRIADILYGTINEENDVTSCNILNNVLKIT